MYVRNLKLCRMLLVILLLSCGDADPWGPVDLDAEADTDLLYELIDRDGSPDTIVLNNSVITLLVTVNPFAFEIRNLADQVVLSTLPVNTPLELDGGAYGLPAAAFAEHPSCPEEPLQWIRFERATNVSVAEGGLTMTMNLSSDLSSATIEVSIEVIENQVRVRLALTGDHQNLNRITQTFLLEPDESFFGLGGHSGHPNLRGSSRACTTGPELRESELDLSCEEGSPFPMPFLLSSAGYGLWIDSRDRLAFHLGSHTDDFWRLEIDSSELVYTVFVNQDPRRTLNNLGRQIGRPRVPALWTFGPRWQIDTRPQAPSFSSQWRKLRELDIATTILEDGLRLLPYAEDRGQEALILERNSQLQAFGFRVLGFSTPHLAPDLDNTARDYSHGLDNHYFVLDHEQQPLLTSFSNQDLPEVATIDLTRESPHSAASWFSNLMRRGVELGYDGWIMGGILVPPAHGVFADGRHGWQLRNEYQLLAQELATELLDDLRADDHLLITRSGHDRTPHLVEQILSDSFSPDFDPESGLPSALHMALNLGFSGVPLFSMAPDPRLAHCSLDRESFSRWTEFAALSPAMTLPASTILVSHRELLRQPFDSGAVPQHPLQSGGSNRGICIPLLNHTTALQSYSHYARLHTRLGPYLQSLAQQASVNGLPLVRHHYLQHPNDSAGLHIQDQYFLGEALLVAPVIQRARYERNVYFPSGSFVHWESGQVVQGPTTQVINAPLGSIPLFIVDGGMVPLLDASIDTLSNESRFDVVGPSDVASILDLRAVRSPGSSTFTMLDGTTLSIQVSGEVAPPFIVNQHEITRAVNHEDLAVCDGCYRLTSDDPPLLLLTTPLGENTVVEGEGITLSASNPSGRARRIRWEVVLLP